MAETRHKKIYFSHLLFLVHSADFIGLIETFAAGFISFQVSTKAFQNQVE